MRKKNGWIYLGTVFDIASVCESERRRRISRVGRWIGLREGVTFLSLPHLPGERHFSCTSSKIRYSTPRQWDRREGEI